MKRLIVLITIAISAISLSKAQSGMKIDLENLHTEISSELSNLPAIINDIHFDWGSMTNDISQSLADIDNISYSIEIGEPDNILVNLGNLNLPTIAGNSIQTEISSLVSDSNNANKHTYAYVVSKTGNKENGTHYSYSTTESPQNTDVFNQLSKIKGIEVVYISSTMLGMMPNMNMPGVDIGNIAGKLESLEIYTAEDDATKNLISVSDKLIHSGAYETLMLVKDSESRTGFYMKKGSSNKGSEMLMITEDDTDATLIRFLGNFTMQDIKNVANQSKNIHTKTTITTSNRMSDAELEMRMKEAQKRNNQAQKIAIEAQKRALEAEKRAEERAKRAEERAKRAEERARKTNQ